MNRRLLIMGAGGRDFHTFNVLFRDDPAVEVVAFTAAQIPCQEGRLYPPELAGPRYPQGIPILDEALLPSLITSKGIDEVVLAYSDLSHQEVMEKASRALALGADFRLIAAEKTMLRAVVPVISVCAVRTGCGKSPVTRHLCSVLKGLGVRPVVVRHPMAYGRLDIRAVEHFRRYEDLEKHQCTIEEREEYEPLLALGVPLFAGVDYERILDLAQRHGDLLIWDGGNNDTPFYRPDLEIVLVDPLREGHERGYYPGLVNLLRADIVVAAKGRGAPAAQVERVRQTTARLNPGAAWMVGALELEIAERRQLAGKRVAVVEDGPTLTHGGMGFGAGTVAARECGVAEIVDPRPYARGSLARVFADYPHLGKVVPAMGYSAGQLDDLAATLEAVPCDLVISGTPVDLSRIVPISKPVLRIGYEFSDGGELKERLETFVAEHRLEPGRAG